MPAEARTTKIAIVGKAPSSRGLAPCDDPSWQIWTLSDLVPQQQVSRFDRHFEIHPLDWIRRPPLAEYWKWLTMVRDKPVYLREPCEEIPAGTPYPLVDVLNHFKWPYWTNSVSYMIALAILERPQAIGVWGVDMAQTDPVLGGSPEYQNQRPSCEWLLGWAQGAGIELVLPAQCDLLKAPYLYGFEHSGPMRAKWEARTAELQGRIQRTQEKLAQADDQRGQLVAKIHTLQGALNSQDYYEQWTFPDNQCYSESSPPALEAPSP